METEKMNSQEGKDNKKISHSSSAKLIPRCLTKFLLLGGSGFEAWRRTSTPSDSPNYCYFIYQVSSAPLFAFSVLWDVPWAHPLPVHFGVSLGHVLSLQLKACSRTQPAWLDCQSVSEKTVGKKTSIASWGKYHALKKIVTKYLGRKQAFRRFSNVVFGKQCWHGAREHPAPGLWCVLYFPRGRAVLGSVLGQAYHIRCCSAVLPGLQPAGSTFLWSTGMRIALPPLFHCTFFAMLLVSGLGDESKVKDTVQAALCSSEMFFLPKLYAHTVPIFDFSQIEPFKATEGRVKWQ